jgi:ubiquinone/menaquinone biosynthesis C-methylase UbiE
MTAMSIRRQDPYLLLVSMAGVKMGDRLVQVGCAHGGRLAALAGKVGLTGRAVAVVPDSEAAARAEKGAADAGVLVEVETAPPTRLPMDDGVCDLAVVDDTGGFVGTMPSGERVAAIRELLRVLRPGGRALIVGTARRSGLAAWLKGGQTEPSFAASGDANAALQTGGFKSVRTLAEREGLVFVEGIKPRAGG